MNTAQPIFTRSADCQDCYKCVRGCPVKAIRVRDGHASVEADTCIFCGRCVSLCPGQAKRIRDDVPEVRRLLRSGRRVVLSLAPSFPGEFTECSAEELVAALQELGFAEVSETAVGAELVSREISRGFAGGDQGLRISSACPVVVDLITKYYPELTERISPEPSPMRAHAAWLRERLGGDIAVVFVGPCIAKKCEADAEDSLIQAAITFADLRRLFTEAGVSPTATASPTAAASPATAVSPAAAAGRMYPIDGGMTMSLSLAPSERVARCMNASGLTAVRETLEGLSPELLSRPLFLELLACEGGCVNGPGMTRSASLLARRDGVVSFAGGGDAAPPTGVTPTEAPRTGGEAVAAGGTAAGSLPPRWQPASLEIAEPGEAELRSALMTVGKHSREDELNCGGCGYDSCRAFAAALLRDRAEPAMCVAYMRRLAQKKNSALLKAMPSAAVTVDRQLRIVESNENFARLCGSDAEEVYELSPGLEGAQLDRFLPQTDLFQAVLKHGGEVTNRTIRIHGAIVNASIFSIEDHHLVGAILQDITDPAMRKQEIVEKSKEVIDKNLQTVQQIAYLLGENASETELILNSIVRSFSGEDST